MKNPISKHDILIALSLILLAILFAPWISSKMPFHVCIFHKVTNYPCPFCGGTRSLAALAKFEFKKAILLNPLVAFTCLAVLILLPSQYISEKIRLHLQKWPFGKIFFISLLLNWLYLILIKP